MGKRIQKVEGKGEKKRKEKGKRKKKKRNLSRLYENCDSCRLVNTVFNDFYILFELH